MKNQWSALLVYHHVTLKKTKIENNTQTHSNNNQQNKKRKISKNLLQSNRKITMRMKQEN